MNNNETNNSRGAYDLQLLEKESNSRNVSAGIRIIFLKAQKVYTEAEKYEDKKELLRKQLVYILKILYDSEDIDKIVLTDSTEEISIEDLDKDISNHKLCFYDPKV